MAAEAEAAREARAKVMAVTILLIMMIKNIKDGGNTASYTACTAYLFSEDFPLIDYNSNSFYFGLTVDPLP